MSRPVGLLKQMQLQLHFVPLEHKLNWNNAFLWTSSHWVCCAESQFPSPQCSVIVETLHVRVEFQTFWVRNDGRDEFDRPPAERVWSAIDVSYHCCQLKHWHQPQQKANVTIQCLMGCERIRTQWRDGCNFTCSIRQLFDATTDKMRYDEVMGDLTSTLSHTSVSSVPRTDTQSISHYHAVRIKQSFVVRPFLLFRFICVLKGRQLHSFLLLNTHTETHTLAVMIWLSLCRYFSIDVLHSFNIM